MGKVISFDSVSQKNSDPSFTKTKDPSLPNEKSSPLTDSMVTTLRLACDKQNQHLLFGPVDIDGSSAALIERGLLKNHQVLIDGKWQLTWYVTDKAMVLLRQDEKKK